MSDRRRDASATGSRTLEIFSDTPRLNAWMVSKFLHRVRGNVLEIGSGIGNLSTFLRARAEHLVLTDVEDSYLDTLRTQFAADPAVTICAFDLDGPTPAPVAARRYDAIVAVNVIEHLEDDHDAVRKLVALLNPGGHLLVYVPAMPALFGSLDRALGHHRRYTARSVQALVEEAGLRVVSGPRYMNALGVAGWFLQGRILHRRTLDPSQVRLFEHLVPLLRQEDRMTLPFGLGVVVHGERPYSQQAVKAP